MVHITVEVVNLTTESPKDAALPLFDAQVAAGARASYKGVASKGFQKDYELLERLAREGHTSPFEHPHISFIVDIPLMAKVHLLRHRHFNFSSQSYRFMKAGT